MLEKGWLGGGNMGRNTSTIRSNYIRDVSIRFNDFSLRLCEELGRDLNYDIMFSQRSQIDIIQSWPKLRDMRRRSLHMYLHGADTEYLTPAENRRRVPILNDDARMRMPVIGGYVRARAGIARHDAIAWGFARGADAQGVEIHQHAEVLGFLRDASGAIAGVETNRGKLHACKVALVADGNSSHVASMAGLALPLVPRNLQAFVSEPLKQLRHWGGALDFACDTSPIITRTDIPGLYVTCGWWGGFKAVPAGGYSFAHLVARDEPHVLAATYTIDRFRRLAYILGSGMVAAR